MSSHTTFLEIPKRNLTKVTAVPLFQHLTLSVPCISESCIEIIINLSFYFHTSLWYLGVYGLHKTFWGTTKKCESKNLTYFFSSSGIGAGRVKFKFSAGSNQANSSHQTIVLTHWDSQSFCISDESFNFKICHIMSININFSHYLKTFGQLIQKIMGNLKNSPDTSGVWKLVHTLKGN